MISKIKPDKISSLRFPIQNTPRELKGELVRDLKKECLWDNDMIDSLKYFDGELQDIDAIPQHLKQKHLNVFSIDFNYFIDAAARRQKWIDQSQSVNLFLASPDMKSLSHMYRHAWHSGLKTTYYLLPKKPKRLQNRKIHRQHHQQRQRPAQKNLHPPRTNRLLNRSHAKRGRM